MGFTNECNFANERLGGLRVPRNTLDKPNSKCLNMIQPLSESLLCFRGSRVRQV